MSIIKTITVCPMQKKRLSNNDREEVQIIISWNALASIQLYSTIFMKFFFFLLPC